MALCSLGRNLGMGVRVADLGAVVVQLDDVPLALLEHAVPLLPRLVEGGTSLGDHALLLSKQ